jgi:hypothetical protein
LLAPYFRPRTPSVLIIAFNIFLLLDDLEFEIAHALSNLGFGVIPEPQRLIPDIGGEIIPGG